MSNIEVIDGDTNIEDTSLLKLIKKFKEENRSDGFNANEQLISLSECIEREQTEFWGRDPDPFDERIPRRIPVAGVFADICNDIIENCDFILDLIIKYVNSRDENVECAKSTLRFVCSILNCCTIRDIFTDFDVESKEQFYNRVFEWALSDEHPFNIYSTYVAGHITKDDDQVIPQRRSVYLNLITLTMARLQQLDKSSRGSMIWNVVVDNRFRLDEGSNASVADLSMSQICGVWNLSNPMKEVIQERLLIFFLRQLAEFETLMPLIYTGGILSLMASWLRGDRHDDIRLTFEALRLLMKLLCHRVIYIDFYDKFDGINLLLNIPRPSVAANAVSYCLYNFLYYIENVNKVIQLPQPKLEQIIKVLLWIIETCHPSARCYGMLCIQCLIRHPITLKIFDKLNGPRYILNSLAILPTLLGDNQNKNARKDYTYFSLLKTTLNTMKLCLEQSLVSWGQEVENAENTNLLAFPSESEISFTKTAVNFIPMAIKLQSWKHPYISDRSNIIKVIYSKSAGVFDDALCAFNEAICSSLDILSILCISNKFVVKFLDFTESDTKSTLKTIFGILTRRLNSVSSNNVKVLKSSLFFLSVLCCRPLQGSRLLMGNANNQSMIGNKSSTNRKRKFEEMSEISDVSEKVQITENRSVNRITSVSNQTVGVDGFAKPRPNVHQEIQNRLWNLVRCYNAIPKLLKIIETPLSPLDAVSIRTWVCHILSGLVRCNDVLLMLRKLPVFNRNVLENLMLESVTPEQMGEHAEFCKVVQRLLRDLRGGSTSQIDKNGGDNLRPDQVRKAEIVGRTQIQWDRLELLDIIYRHLQKEGLNDVADQLRQRANLPITNYYPNISLYEDSSDNHLHQPVSDSLAASFSRLPQTPKRSVLSCNVTSTPKIVSHETSTQQRPRLYRENLNQSMIMTKSAAIGDISEKTTCLDEIVETFFRTQHAKCSNPISICPKFSFHEKHVCPSIDEPHRPQNILHYITKRSYDCSPHTINNRVLRRYVHRNFKPRVVLSETDVFEEDTFSENFCFAKGLDDGLFFASKEHGIVFTDMDLAQTSVEIGEVDFAVSNIENTKDGRLLMVSSDYSKRGGGAISLFNVSNRVSAPITMKVEKVYQYSGYTELSKTNDSKFVVLQDKAALVVDVETNTVLHTCSCSDDSYVGSYRNVKNRATFSYDDSLLLSHGTLWDVRCAVRENPVVDSFLHRFDNFEDIISGVFHPNGYDVIIGSAVWDIRTYRLLRNIPSLKSSRIVFNEPGDFFYTYKECNSPFPLNPMARGLNLFQCYDSRDYSVVATVNTSKVITSLVVDPKDLGVAVIENNDDGGSHAQCRVFSVGYKWSSSVTCDIDDDVGGDDDDDDDYAGSDLEFVVDLNNLLNMSESENDSIGDDDDHDGLEPVDGEDADENEDFSDDTIGDSVDSDSDYSTFGHNEDSEFDEDDEDEDGNDSSDPDISTAETSDNFD